MTAALTAALLALLTLQQPATPAPQSAAGEVLIGGLTADDGGGQHVHRSGRVARRCEGPDDPAHAAGGRFAYRADRSESRTIADGAVKAAWAIYRPDAKWPLKVTNDFPDKDGWTNIRDYSYQTSPNEKRDVGVSTQRANDTWTVTIYDMAQAVGEKRGAQVALIFGRLFPKGYERETFAGKTAKKLGDKEIAALATFLETGLQKTRVPGVALGLVQDGKVVFADGFGVRELGGTDEARRRHAVHDRVEHQGADHADAREARGRGQDARGIHR